MILIMITVKSFASFTNKVQAHKSEDTLSLLFKENKFKQPFFVFSGEPDMHKK